MLSIIIIIASFLLLFSIDKSRTSTNRLQKTYESLGKSKKEWGITESIFRKYASFQVFVATIFSSPYPTLVNIPLDTTNAPIRTGNYIIGFAFLWNFLSFFGFKGLYVSVFKHRKKTITILLFTFMYLVMLAYSNSPMNYRHKLTVFPFLIILTAAGVQFNFKKDYKIFLLFCFVIFLAIFFWNYIRLAGRGLI